MFFRAFDEDRNGILDQSEFINALSFAQHQFTAEQEKAIFGKETWTFADFYKFHTSNDIDPETDPYDGKLVGQGSKYYFL
jgi:Ca2+-binding EF-hand superfamily protein